MSTVPQWFLKTTFEDILSVSAVELLGPIAWRKLFAYFPSLQDALKAPLSELKKVVTESQAQALLNRPLNQEVTAKLCQTMDIKVVYLGQKQYPELLAEIVDPPLWLFYKGNLKALEQPLLSVVGSRKCSIYAKTVSEKLLTLQLLNRVTTVSGLAYGIDKIVHQLSLNAKRPTVAVLAGGLDSIYPIDHTNLANEIVKQEGLLLSEYPPLSRPKTYRFPIRNRIIAGLSPITIIMEAAIKSGSLTTAKSAIDYNRDVFAVPGDITRLNSAGTNFLLQRGATPLTTPAQLYDYFHISKKASGTVSLDRELQEILDLLSPEALSIDQIVVVIHQPIEVVLGLVTQLELLDLVYQPKPGVYMKK